jgi:hypothetical protein
MIDIGLDERDNKPGGRRDADHDGKQGRREDDPGSGGGSFFG